MASRLPISGLKRSTALIQLNLSAGASPPIADLLAQLADCRVNLAFLTMVSDHDGVHCAVAVAAESWPVVEPLVGAAAPAVEIISPVGTLTLFPHRWRPDLLACVLSAFEKAQLPVYDIASSLASLTFATDYRRLDEAVGAIRDVARLPENHAPFDNPWRIRQL